MIWQHYIYSVSQTHFSSFHHSGCWKNLLKLILLATKVWRFELARINNIDVIADKKQIAGSFVQVQHFQWRNENNDMLPRHSVENAEIYPYHFLFMQNIREINVFIFI